MNEDEKSFEQCFLRRKTKESIPQKDFMDCYDLQSSSSSSSYCSLYEIKKWISSDFQEFSKITEINSEIIKGDKRHTLHIMNQNFQKSILMFKKEDETEINEFKERFEVIKLKQEDKKANRRISKAENNCKNIFKNLISKRKKSFFENGIVKLEEKETSLDNKNDNYKFLINQVNSLNNLKYFKRVSTIMQPLIEANESLIEDDAEISYISKKNENIIDSYANIRKIDENDEKYIRKDHSKTADETTFKSQNEEELIIDLDKSKSQVNSPKISNKISRLSSLFNNSNQNEVVIVINKDKENSQTNKQQTNLGIKPPTNTNSFYKEKDTNYTDSTSGSSFYHRMLTKNSSTSLLNATNNGTRKFKKSIFSNSTQILEEDLDLEDNDKKNFLGKIENTSPNKNYYRQQTKYLSSYKPKFDVINENSVYEESDKSGITKGHHHNASYSYYSFKSYKPNPNDLSSEKTNDNNSYLANSYIEGQSEIKESKKEKKKKNQTKNSQQKSKEINIVDILTKKDSRTTVMIRHIPNKYTLDDLIYEIDELFFGKYTYINLPLDFSVSYFIIIIELS